MRVPKISIVTPSFNQGEFIESTILSVLGQQYDNLEYMIFDGGSSDNSVEIIRRYEGNLAAWSNQPDGGQSDAINRALSAASGDVFAWLNSDDMYLPGSLSYIASFFCDDEPKIVFGNCIHFSNEDPRECRGSDVKRAVLKHSIELTDYIIQPSCFFSRSAWRQVGALDASLSFGFDWEWFIRARHMGVKFVALDKYLALYRIHSRHKSAIGGEARRRELASIYRRHSGSRFERMYLDACRRRSTVERLVRWSKRFRMESRQYSILRWAVPSVFSGFSDSEINDVIAMID